MHKRKAVAEFEEPVAYSKAERPSTKAVRPSNDEEEGVQPGEQQVRSSACLPGTRFLWA